jgi:NADH-quinone oxidoreductase subunit M
MNILLFAIVLLAFNGIITLLNKKIDNRVGGYSLLGLSAMVISFTAVLLADFKNTGSEQYSKPWITDLGVNLSFVTNGTNLLMCLLTAICFLVIALISFKKDIARPGVFYGLMLLSFAGLLGVFLANDAFLFYIFWELALIPVYFLCSMWGGENRSVVSFKFFIYTFVGSLIMLVGLIYLYNKTPDHSFSWDSFKQLADVLTPTEQINIFWVMFIAFAIKMPIFPLHTWQPNTYKETFTPVTMVLSAVMVKMGLYAVLHWLLPILPHGVAYWQTLVMALSIFGIIYASLLAMVQKDIKKLVAYSSIAHVGLMCAAMFGSPAGIEGTQVQMFSHGINIIGMWVCVYFIERYFSTTNMDEMGGIAQHKQMFTIFFVLITLANIALPLTNGFIGEFMMFNGLFGSANKYATLFTVVAGLGVILSAVYSLTMIQKVAYGESKNNASSLELSLGEKIALFIIAALILIFGIFPQPIIDLIKL